MFCSVSNDVASLILISRVSSSFGTTRSAKDKHKGWPVALWQNKHHPEEGDIKKMCSPSFLYDSPILYVFHSKITVQRKENRGKIEHDLINFLCAPHSKMYEE